MEDTEVYTKIDKTLKRKWLKALRSGTFKRGRSQLKIEAGTPDENKVVRSFARHCCLGVLCEVAKVDFDPSNGDLPMDFQQHVLNMDVGAHEHLIILNDTKDWSFKKIADWVEKNL